MTRSPGQWAPWISDPDPPAEPMTPEQLQKMSDGVKELLAQPARNSSSPPPMKTTDQMHEELIRELMRDHQFTREEAEKQLDGFF